MQAITASSQAAVDAYDAGVSSYLALAGNPVADLEVAIQRDPDFLMGHALIGMLFVLSTGYTPSHPTLARSLAKTRELVAKGVGTEREQAFVAALHLWADGRIRAASHVLESILLRHPTDAVTIRAAHDTNFFTGDSINLRNSIARVFREWDPSMPEYAKICGMLAFGYACAWVHSVYQYKSMEQLYFYAFCRLEENNQYGEAEEYGMQAINMDPTDAWGLHAIIHVYEMQARQNEGRLLLKEMKVCRSVNRLFVLETRFNSLCFRWSAG
jgi:tetratricopeptide (TPR) repeat protein